MKWRVWRTAVLWEKHLRTSFGNIGHSIANAFGKTFFHNVFALWLRLARPTSRVRRAGAIKCNKHTSLIACLATVFVSGCWGYYLGFLKGDHGKSQYKWTISDNYIYIYMLNYHSPVSLFGWSMWKSLAVSSSQRVLADCLLIVSIRTCNEWSPKYMMIFVQRMFERQIISTGSIVY